MPAAKGSARTPLGPTKENNEVIERMMDMMETLMDCILQIKTTINIIK
jgi:hypothetical protein